MRPLFELLLHCLSSSIEDQQQMSVRCLSEIVKKMGERVLAVILPILEDRLKNGGADDRRGVALALGEIINNTHRFIFFLKFLGGGGGEMRVRIKGGSCIGAYSRKNF